MNRIASFFAVLSARCESWTTPWSAPVLGRSKVELEERMAYWLVSDVRTLLRPGTAALRLCHLCRRLLSKFSAATLAAFLLAIAAAPAQTNPPPSLEEITRAMAKAHTVLTRFVQERHLSLFTEPLHSEGWLCFQTPGRLRWETVAPYKSILVSDGAGVAQFEWTGAQWKKLDLGLGDALENVMSQIAGVMDGRFARDQQGYTAAVNRNADELVITLIPRHEMMRKMIAAIEVHLAADLQGTRRVVLRETDGDYTDITFTEQTVNFALPPKTFDRSAPAALEEIRAAAGKKP